MSNKACVNSFFVFCFCVMLVLRLVCLMLPVSLDCPFFFIIPLVFSDFYIHLCVTRETKPIKYIFDYVEQNNTKKNPQKTLNMSNKYLNKNPGVNTGTRDGLVVADSYKTPTILLIFKSGKSNVVDRRNTGVTYECILPIIPNAPVFSAFSVTQSLVLCVCFVDRCLFFSF